MCGIGGIVLLGEKLYASLTTLLWSMSSLSSVSTRLSNLHDLHSNVREAGTCM